MQMTFSFDAKTVIAESRNIAMDLGYDYISTIHFFLADCKRNSNYTIKNFAFKTDEELQQFHDSQIIGLPNMTEDNLPLTKEAEDMLRRAAVLVQSTYNARAVQPWHLFLAGTQLDHTLLYKILTPKEGLYERLDLYYTELGVINRTPPPPERKSFWSKLFK
jgi:hypothetical protein